jgi:uncharacterized membrane protein YkvA (DUF1232 family)
MRKLFFVMWRMSKADLRLLWFALKRADRPGWLFPAAAGLALYALAPFNLVIPVMGAVDDLMLAPLALHYLLKLLPPHIMGSLANQSVMRAR